MIEKIRYKEWDVYYLKGYSKVVEIAKNIIENNNINIKEEYKNTERNYVVLLEYENVDYVLKSPKNEVNIPQRRYMSFFKKGEALTTLYNVTKLRKEGVEELYIPYLAMERRKRGILRESYLLTEYLEGETLKPYGERRAIEMPVMVKTLTKIHKLGYWHGDANGSNFIMTSNGVKTIDTKIRKDLFSYGEAYDMFTLDKSAMNVEEYYEFKKATLGYWLALCVKGFKNNKIVSNIKKYKKQLRQKGWKI